MAKGQPKKKKAKKDVFTVYFNYDGIFTSFPLKYSQGQMKELNDTNFDEILGVRELKLTQDIADMLKVGYDNGNEIDMYVEHFGYDIMELAELERNEEQNYNIIKSVDDEYYDNDDCEEIKNVDFQTKGESVMIKNISTHDPFLNKLCNLGLCLEVDCYVVFKEIIEDSFISLRKMRDDIRQKFMIDVSLRQCRRTKQLALFDHKGGLIEHYGKLYQYWQALLDSNHGSTCWFLHLLPDDLSLNDGNGITIISDSHKGLIDVVNDWLPEAEHKKCPRHKPIITMLVEIMLYIMQRLVAMNKLAFKLEDKITPNVRKRLEIFKEKQREWIVFPSGFQGLEIRKDDQSYGVSLQHKEEKKAIVSHCASRGRGRGRGGIENESSGSGMGGIREANGRGRGRRGGGMASSGGKRGGGRGSRGVGSTRGVGMVGSSSMGILTSEEEYQLQLDEMAFRECMEEQAKEQAIIDTKQERLDKERREEQELEEKQDYFNPDTTDVTTKNIDDAPAIKISETTDMAEGIASAMVEDLSTPAVDKGKGKESVKDESSAPKKKSGRPPSHVDGIRIFYKNHKISKRISNMKEKKAFQFDNNGTGSTPDKAFDVDD
ncbi:hypothetical protein Tco_0299833 [Tanacetum coccineum]